MKLSEVAGSIANIGKVTNGSVTNALQDDVQNSHGANSETFSQLLKNSIHELNNSQVSAYDAMNDIATGKVQNLPEAVQKLEEAELSLKLGLEVKNKALGAYKQIMSMQI